MSMYVNSASKELGQFASNNGFTDLVAASKSDHTLKMFFDAGSADGKHVVDAVCVALRKVAGDADVKSTANGLADMIDGQDLVFITDGTHDGDDDGVDKYSPDQPRNNQGEFGSDDKSPGSIVTGSGWYTKEGKFIAAPAWKHNEAARQNGLSKDDHYPAYAAIKSGHVRIAEMPDGRIGLEYSPDKGSGTALKALSNMVFPNDKGVIMGPTNGASHEGDISSAKAWLRAQVSKAYGDDEYSQDDHEGEDDQSEQEDSYDDADKFELHGQVVKLDGPNPQRLVFGFFSVTAVNGKTVEDTQGDMITSDTLESAAYEFVLNARTAGEMHEQDGDGEVRGIGRLVESVVLTDEKQRAMLACLHAQGITDAALDLRCVCWWGGFKISNDSTWDKVTSGELKAFSIGGKGKRAAV